jgi:hypothetical protein
MLPKQTVSKSGISIASGNATPHIDIELRVS